MTAERPGPAGAPGKVAVSGGFAATLATDPPQTAITLASAVPDPELPMVTIGDLGVLRGVEVHADAGVTVTVTPTYSGCPALAEIRADLRRTLSEAGYRDVEIRTVLAPPWTTDWITDEGRRKLAEAGIAPPTPREPAIRSHRVGVSGPLAGRIPLDLRPPAPRVHCPNCGAPATEELSAFGPTACTALRRCPSCREPFSHMRPL